jgi:hypothetical protein
MDMMRYGRTGNEVVNPGYGTTYYPDTRDPSAAASVEVPAGAEVIAIDFTLEEQQLYRIQGRVFGPDGVLPRNVSVMLYPRNGLNSTVMGGAGNSYDVRNGTFELRDVAIGSYWLHATSVAEPSISQTARSGAQVAVDVTSDIQNVVLTLNAGMSLPVTVAIEGLPSIAALPDFSRIRICLRATNEAGLAPNPPPLSADGKLTIGGILPGMYRVLIAFMPPGMYLKEARLEGSDVLQDGFLMTGPVSGALQILLSLHAGQVDGIIVDKDDKPSRGSVVVLVPELDRARRDLYRGTTTDQYGHFSILSVIPGEYRLLAWEDLEPLAYYERICCAGMKTVAFASTSRNRQSLRCKVK